MNQNINYLQPMNKTVLYSKIRAKILHKLDKYAGKIGMYTSYRIKENEKVGSTDKNLAELIREIEDVGYEYNSLSAAKQHSETSKLECGSFRRIPEKHPELDASAPDIIRNWKPNESQFHIHLFKIEDTIEVTSHYELRPDLLKPDFSRERLETHYRPEWNETYLPGVCEPDILDIF